ncbi:MAG: TRAP transporter substrate-binding protein [Parasporobacterium sp.]|nr:TRAP transporter substrate-binding protein [Parasporobacterium sp.]
MKKILVLILAAVMVFSMASAAFAEEAPEVEAVSLKLGTFPGDTMDFMNQYAEMVNEASGGKITIEVLNFLTMGSPVDAVNMCKSGALDILIMSGNDYVGYAPCSAAIAVPFAVKDVEEAFKVEQALLANDFFQDWEGEVLAILLTDMQYIAMAKKEITSKDDFSGLIGRCQNANGIAVLSSLGASITTITTNEVYNALNTGVIDFSVSSPTNMISSSYGEVVDYIVDQPLYCDANCLIMNQAKYDSLSDAAKQILKDCGTKLEEDYNVWNVNGEKEAIETLKEQGVNFIPCPEDVLAAMEEAAVTCKADYDANLQKAGVDTDLMNKVIEEALAAE